jgi:hypothetical protein
MGRVVCWLVTYPNVQFRNLLARRDVHRTGKLSIEGNFSFVRAYGMMASPNASLPVKVAVCDSCVVCVIFHVCGAL